MTIFVLFIANAAVMVLEIVGARALAPFMGTSTEVWSGLIGTILLGLTLGYYYGGKVADLFLKKQYSLYKLASTLLVCAGIFTLISWTNIDAIALLGASLMGSLGLTFATASVALIAFVPASLCLSALSPIIARIKLSKLESAASTIGSLSAIAAAGSIIGSFSAGLLFIPYFGSKETLIGIGVLLLLCGLLLATKAKWNKKNAFVFLLLLILPCVSYVASSAEEFNERHGIIADIDTKYQRLWIRDGHLASVNRDVREIKTDPFGTQCAMYKYEMGGKDTHLVFPYTLSFAEVTFLLANHTNKVPENVIVVGGCNYSFPLYLSQQFPKTAITVSELDPKMEVIAREWFGFEKPESMNIVTGDARNFFNASATTKADIIYYDAFNASSSIPPQLATKEAFEAVKKHMKDDGVFVLNIISSLEGETSEMGASMYKTLSEVFPHVSFYKIIGVSDSLIQNIIGIASNTKDPFGEIKSRFLETADLSKLSGSLVFTDNYAPVERVSKPIRDYVIENH